MKREAFKMFLKPGCEAEYERRHAQIWPELKQLLSENGVYDYSIYWDKDTNILYAVRRSKEKLHPKKWEILLLYKNGGIIWLI